MATNIEQQWAEIGLKESMDYTPDAIETNNAENTTNSTTNSLTDRFYALQEKSNAKIAKINETTQIKDDRLKGYEDVTIVGMEDADTYKLSDGRVVRVSDPLYRYDAAEVYHPDLQDGILNKIKNTLGLGEVGKSDYASQTQREHVGRILGKGPNVVTDEDIYSVGNMQQIQALSDLSMNKGDERWTAQVEPGAAQVDLNQGLNIGAKIKVNGTDMYGRVLADVVNPRTGDNVTRLHAQDTRLNAFAPGYKTIGKEFDSNGKMIDTVDRDGMMGEAVDIGQSSLVKQYAGTVDALNEGVRWLVNKAGVEPESVEKYFPKDYKIGLVGDGKYTAKQLARDDITADKLAGVMASTREDQQKSMETAKKNLIDGDYVGAAGEVMSTLPYMLGDSAGEMGAIMLGTPGIISAVGNRVNSDAEDYKKNNEGKEPDTNWILGSTLLNSAALFGEKFLLKSGISSIIEKGLSKSGRTGAVAQSTVGETAQEWFDQTQQMYMTQKEGQRTTGEIATSPDAAIAALSGGIMGGALSGTGHVAGAAKDKLLNSELSDKVNNKINEIKTKKESPEPVVEANEVLDENQKAVYETNFTDAESRLEALTPLSLRDDVSNDEYMSGFEEINAIKEHIINGMKSGTIDKARSDAAVAKLKDINAKMHAGVIKMINDGDEQAMNTLFSDPETAETKFRKIATSGSEDLDIDGANFMKAGYSAGLNDETITDIKDEAKALNRLNGRIATIGTEAGATGKSMDKVAQEVSRDARGYLTYKDLADEGIESNNVGKINKNLVYMEKFYGKHSAKLDSINDGLSDAESKAEKIIANFIENGKAKNRNEALIELTALDENKKPKYSLGQIEITYGRTENKGKINIIDSIKRLNDENYNGGMYGIRESVKNETEAMGTVFELTKKRAENIGTFAKQFTDKTEVDYVNEIKNLEPEVIKLREKVAKYELVDKEDLNENVVNANIAKLKNMENSLKAAQDNLAKIKGTKVDDKTETTTPGSENKEPIVPKEEKVSGIIDPNNPPADVSYEEPKIVEPSEPKEQEITIKDDFDGIDVSTLKPIDVSDMSKYPMIEFTGDNPSVMNINYADPIDPFSNYKEPTDAEIAAFLSKPVDPEYKDYADINVDNIANFDNIDSIKATTEKEKAAKSEAIKLLEAELIKAKEALSKEKEIYNALKNKITDLYAEKQEIYERNSGKKQWNEDDSSRMEWLNEQTESAKQYLPRFVNEKINFKKEIVNGIIAKLSGSAEIESIIKDTGLGAIVSEKTKMIEKDKDGKDQYQIIKSSEIVKGNKKATNRLSGMKIEDITDNKTVLDYADSAVKTLSNVVDKVEKKYNKFGKEIESDKILTDVNGLESGLKEVQKLRDSLFRGILFNADGSINKNVATAIAMTGDEYRALMASKLAFNTKEDIAKMLGITEGEVTGLMTRTMAFNGSFKKLIADDLSTTLFKNLAISGVDTVDKELVAKMKADAGQIVLLYMQEKGYIEPLSTSTMTVKQYETMMEKDEGFAKEMFTEFGESENGATIPMVRLAGTRDANGNQIRLKGKAKEAQNKKFSDETAKITKTLDVLGSTFGIESTKKGYKTKPSKTDSKKVKNSKVNNMSDKALKTMNVLQAESFEMNGGVEVLFELDENGNRLIDDATILKAMGYKTEEELKGKSFNTVESAEARNMEIENSLEELKSLRARVLDPEDEMTNEMYFDYFFGKNGRFYMDSVGIKPQTEKQLHRWLITPKSHNVTIDFNSKNGKAKRQKDMFRLAIAQAFGFAIDKKSNVGSYAFANAIMAADESELLKVLKPNEKGKFEHQLPGSEHTLEIEHIGHTMQAISALRAYRDAKGGPFTTSMSVEFDAVTSGFIIKLMQMPILGMKLVKEWLAKGGVFLGGIDGYNGGDIKDIKSMSDVIAENGITDAYRTLAGKMQTPKEVTDKYYEKHKDRNNKVKVANRVLGAMIPLLGNIKNDIDEVTKEGRALFKDPFMTFNYAAGMASIKKSLGYKMTENLADEMLTGSEKGNALIGALFGVEFNKIDKSVIANFKEQILTKDFDEVKINGEVKVSELMRKIIENAYGNQVESILGKEFDGLVKANGTINNAFKGVFLAWKKEYDAKVAEVIAKGGVLSSKVEDEIILDLKDKFPMINAPLSSGNIEDLETVAIYSTKLSSGKDKRYGAAKTYINKDNDNNPKGQQTLTIQSMIREFEAAMSAGAVIPIHYIDGSFMTNVLEASGILGVHDAVVTGMDNAFDTVKNYNKNVYENSRDYSVIEELSKLVNRNAKGNESIIIREAKGDNEAITFGDIVNDLNKLNAEVKEARRVLFNTDVKVMHMTAIDDTDYSEIDGQGTIKKENELVEYAEPDGASIKVISDSKLRKEYVSKSNGKAVSTLRNEGIYGNPFGSTQNANTSVDKAGNDKEVSKMFRDWIIGTSNQDVEPERRQQIVDNILSGKLDNIELVYYRDIGDNHAKELLKLINNKSLIQVKTHGSEEIVKESAGLTITKSGFVKYKGTNKSQKKIESYAEFKSIVNEYASIMNSKKAKGDKTTDEMNKYVDSMFEMLANSGIEFRPFELKFSKNVGDNDSGLGLHKTYDSGLTIITMPFDVDFGNESPLRVVLHEYAHSITKKAMKDNKEKFMATALRLRDHAIKKMIENGMTQDEINKTYAFSDKKDEAYEFIAEALTSPKLQRILSKIPSVSENKNVLEDIKKFFNAIVKFVTKNDESKFEMNNVLSDTLNLVIEIQNENGLLNKDYNPEPDVNNSIDDIALINNALDIMKILKNEYISNAKQQKDRTSDDYKDLSKLATDFAKIEKMIEGCK